MIAFPVRPTIQKNEQFGYLIIDGLLPDDQRGALHAYAINDSFFYENAFEWNRVWHPLSGKALLTGPKSYGETRKPGPRYPTETPYDAFFRAVESHLDELGHFLGLEADAIKYVMSAYLYRAGWGLPWHEDIGQEAEYKGAFTYYLHKQWRGNWGGELLLLAEDRLAAPTESSIDLAFTQGTGLAAPSHIESGIGTFILPKSNRLVVLRPGVVHSVAPVSPLAGENMRFSLAGFYL